MFPSGAEVPSPLRSALPPWVVSPKIKIEEVADTNGLVHDFIESITGSPPTTFAQYSRSDYTRQYFLHTTMHFSFYPTHR